MNGNIEEGKISSGILEFERFKSMATEAIETAKKAKEEADYYRGQNQLLTEQHQADEARHRADLGRIAELEAFVTTILEQYRAAEEKLRLGTFRRPNSRAVLHEIPVAPNGATPAVASAVGAALEDELRRLQQPRPLVAPQD